MSKERHIPATLRATSKVVRVADGLPQPQGRFRPNLPSEFNNLLELLVAELERANTTERCIEIMGEMDDLDHLLKRRNLGFDAQQLSAILRIETETRIGRILEDTPRQGIGRPRKNDSSGIILPTYKHLGVRGPLAYRCLRPARIPGPLRRRLLQRAYDNKIELTTNWVLAQCEAEIQRRKNLEPKPGGRIDDLYALVRGDHRFGCILVDAPWIVAGTTLPYPSMSVKQIAALPIHELADPERCHLHMWVLPGRVQADAYEIVRGWGFRVVGDFVWIKKTKRLGRGNYWRGAHETLLTAVLADRDDRFDDHSLPSYGNFPRGRHSAKPEAVRQMIERASPGPRLELFARREVPGWITWGHEVETPAMKQVPGEAKNRTIGLTTP